MDRLAFLAFESPWPAYSGADKRVAGLLSELARAYPSDVKQALAASLKLRIPVR
jgi:hypothetical protein